MLKFRIIPIVLVDGPNVVKGSLFDNWRRISTLAPVLNVYNSRDVDELILLDTRASRTSADFNLSILSQALFRLAVPLSVGGGIRSADDVARLIDQGADKVVIGSAFSSSPKIVEASAARFGSQALVVSIDVRRNADCGYEAFGFGGKTLLSDAPVELARVAQEAGAGEIMVNSISRDGTMQGFDLEIVAEITDAVAVPVIGAGGAGSEADFVELVSQTGASAAAAGSVFAFTEATPESVRLALRSAGVPVRRPLNLDM